VVKLLGISLLCASLCLWQLKPVYKPLFGGWLGSEIYVGRLVAIPAFIGGVALILIA
jgi:hypothetical protein